MAFTRFVTSGLLALAAVLPFQAVAASCDATSFSSLSATSCAGSFSGNINGSTSETNFLNAQWGEVFTFAGKSDDADSGPFANNPTVSNDGLLNFDQEISGKFVIGIKAANNFSYYFFNATSPVSSLTFNSTAGISTNRNGMAQDLSHAALYIAAVPEPESYAMMLAGLGLIGGIARRRKQQQTTA